MVKKLVLLASAIAAMAALVAPAAANATPVLTSTNNPGVPIPVNTAITGTANASTIRLHTETSLGDLECEKIMLNGKVTKNTGTEIEGVGVAGSTTSNCSFEGLEPAEVENIEIVRLFTNMIEGETGTGTFEAAYASKIPGGAVCKFSNKGKPGVFHYKLGTDKLIITKTNVTSSGCGESFLTGEVTLETENGTPIIAS